MTRTAHSDLEHHILIATLCMKGNAYSVSVVQAIEARTGNEVALSAWLIALQRLGEKGPLQSSVEDRREKSGSVRRYFDPTAAGMERLREMRRSLVGLWDAFAVEMEGTPWVR